MEPNSPNPPVESPPAPQPVETMSLGSRLMNVFASPGDVFQDIKDKPVNHLNWVVPGIIIVVVGWLASLIIFSQEPIKQQMKEISQRAIQKQFEQKNLPKEQMDKAMEAAEKYGGIGTMVSAFFIPIFSGFLTPVIWGLIFWGIGSKILGGQFPYLKAVEAMGLVNMISVLDGLVRTLLVITMSNVFVSPSLMLLVKDWNPENKVHALLAYVNVMTFWILAVRGVAAARLSRKSFLRAAAWIFGVWITYSALFFGFGLLMQQVFSKMGAGGR